jgi:hypothetical protein
MTADVINLSVARLSFLRLETTDSGFIYKLLSYSQNLFAIRI